MPLNYFHTKPLNCSYVTRVAVVTPPVRYAPAQLMTFLQGATEFKK